MLRLLAKEPEERLDSALTLVDSIQGASDDTAVQLVPDRDSQDTQDV